MKRALFIATIFLTGHMTVTAQKSPIWRVDARVQTVLGGAHPSTIQQEGGNEIKSGSNSKLNYYFFATYSASAKIRWSNLWVKGVNHTVHTDAVSSIPEMEPGVNTRSKETGIIINVDKDVKSRIMQLSPVSLSSKAGPKAPWFRNMIRDNELVIVYIYMGKTWYYPVPKIKMLEAVPAS